MQVEIEAVESNVFFLQAPHTEHERATTVVVIATVTAAAVARLPSAAPPLEYGCASRSLTVCR